MNTSQNMTKSAHICITQYSRNETWIQQKTGTHTHLSQYVNM